MIRTLIVALALAAPFALAACTSTPDRPLPVGAEGEPPPSPTDLKVVSATAAIESIRPWVITEYGPDDVKALERAARTLQSLPQEKVREAIVHLAYRIHRKGGLLPASQVYVILRAMFDVPTAYPREKMPPEFGAWLHPSTARVNLDKPFDLAWPVRVEGDRITEVHRFPGYVGNPYDAVGEYDWMRANFPLRKLAPES